MFERGARLGLSVALLAFVAGGCAPTTNSAISSDAGARSPGAEGTTNFASPTDMIQRYPMMRRQDL
jgi:hypothetical protein